MERGEGNLAEQVRRLAVEAGVAPPDMRKATPEMLVAMHAVAHHLSAIVKQDKTENIQFRALNVEYERERSALGRELAAIGLSVEELPAGLRGNLGRLAQLAASLGIDTAEPAALGAAALATRARGDRCAAEEHRLATAVEKDRALADVLARMAAGLARLLEREPIVARATQIQEDLHAVTAAPAQGAGPPALPSLSEAALLPAAQRVASRCGELEQLRARLARFNALPADVVRARTMLSDVQAEIAALQERFASSLDSIG